MRRFINRQITREGVTMKIALLRWQSLNDKKYLLIDRDYLINIF